MIRTALPILAASVAMLLAGGCAASAPRADASAASLRPIDRPEAPPRLQVPTEDRLTKAGVPERARVDPVIERRTWTLLGRAGSMMLTPNYRIYSTIDDARLEGRTPRFLEFALRHYCRALGRLAPPNQTMETYVLGTRPQWESITRRLVGRNAATYLRIQRGGYALNGRGVYWDIGAHDTLQIAAHEGWHQFTQATFRNPLPTWLEEGVACYMEGFRWHEAIPDTPSFLPWANTERFDQLRKASSAGTLMSLEELLMSRVSELVSAPGDGSLSFYAQVWALVHFLNEGAGGRYEPALRALLRDASEGTLYGNVASRLGERAARRAMLQRRGTEVFAAYFEPELAAADVAYRGFIAEIVRTGGRDAVVEGRSPVRSVGGR